MNRASFQKSKSSIINLQSSILIFLLSACLLTACGEAPRTTGVPATPTSPPTPAGYANVPDAATVGTINRPPTVRPTSAPNVPSTTPADTTTEPEETVPEEAVAAPVDRIFGDIDPATLERLYGVQPPLVRPGGNAPLPTNAPRIARVPSGVAPTPTLNSSPTATKIEALKNTQVSFMNAYRPSSLKLLESSRNARLVFASANVLKPERTVWSFFFVAPETPRMWRVIYDSNNPATLDIRESAPTNVADVSRIDMSKVLDSASLVDRAALNGLNVTTPVDIVSFGVEGVSKQPCFVFTNTAQGKQVAVHAYTGAVLRSDF
jgi:hypothetical protein